MLATGIGCGVGETDIEEQANNKLGSRPHFIILVIVDINLMENITQMPYSRAYIKSYE